MSHREPMGPVGMEELVPEKDRWRCRLCDKHHVVPSLARDCEAKHLNEEEPEDG